MLKEVKSAGAATPITNFPRALHQLRPDLSLEIITSLIIDEAAYYSDHKDVLRSGITAADHYYRHGEKERRKFTFPRLGFSRTQTPHVVVRGKTVYYTTVPADNASWLYRCVFPTENRGGNNVLLSGSTPLSQVLLSIFSAKSFVLLRPVYSLETIYLMQVCRRIGVHVQIDYDDLLLPEFARQRGVCRSGLRKHVDDFKDSIKQSTLTSQADSLTCSTEAIAVELRKINPNVKVVKNKLPQSMFLNLPDVMARNLSRDLDQRKLKVLYLSGSNTHKRDFSTIMGPLVKLAQEMPNEFSVTFMGSLADYSALFKALGVKSHTHPYVTFDKMLKIIGDHDLVLVPLEFSVFNHCKSNIKYIESATQGVPVIASSVAEFSSAIENGVNGWLCDDEHQWYDTLKNIIANPRMTATCGANALARASKEYSV
nr:glycosyltransferase [uncultured Pseudomonas sp.]